MRRYRDNTKVGRNEPCPCGSGQKFKKCCLGKGRDVEARGEPGARGGPEWHADVVLPPPIEAAPGTIELHPRVPRDLRRRLERARLENLVLLRSLDRAGLYMDPMDFTPELRAVFELEADCVEALWGLDQPLGAFDVGLMLRDTLASLDRLPRARRLALAILDDEDLRAIEEVKPVVERTVLPEECYSQVKGRDPEASDD